jgi:hypothetical protein
MLFNRKRPVSLSNRKLQLFSSVFPKTKGKKACFFSTDYCNGKTQMQLEKNSTICLVSLKDIDKGRSSNLSEQR